MHINVFKKIAKQVADLEKSGVKFDVTIPGDNQWTKGCALAHFEPAYYEVSSLAQLSQLQQIMGKPISVLAQAPNSYYQANSNKVTLADFKVTNCTSALNTEVNDERDFQKLRQKYPTVKFFTPNIKGMSTLSPIIICDVPAEKTEDSVTYRYIGTAAVCEMCVPHTSDIYNYLDKGFIYAKINRANERDKLVITNELTPDTYLVMLGALLQPQLAKQLQHECYVNYTQAKLFRIKFEKELNVTNKGIYDRVKEVVLRDYEKWVNSNMLVKVIKNELPLAAYNRIKLTNDSANYEGIVIEAKGILSYLYDRMIFDDRTDIYTIIGTYITSQIAELESSKFPELKEGEKEAVIERNFQINGININVKRTSTNTRRYVNGYPINIEELDPVCYRASCFDSQDIFDKFVKSVHTMSLKWHDAIGNGLSVKIHDALTALEYKKHEAPSSAPRIRFRKEDKEIYLITGDGDNDKAPIKLNLAIKKIASLNRKTNNRYSVNQGYTPRNAAWARKELVNVLKECCTFEEKQLIVDADEKPVLDAEGKKQYTVTQNCLLTDDKAAFIAKMAQTYYDKAVKKSKIALEIAIKQTGATSIMFNGEDCWYVEGNLHKYAVSKKTNTVFNFERGNYICIVEPGHRVETGFDATASRLLALKNDSVRVKSITTLSHG